MSLELTTNGRALFNDSFRAIKPKFNDFEFVRDGEHTWNVFCPGMTFGWRIAKFTGTYIEGARALKMQLITSRLCM